MSISTAGRGGSHILDPPFVEHGDGGDHEYEHLSGRVLRLERDLEEEIRIKSAATLSKLPPIYEYPLCTHGEVVLWSCFPM